MKKIACALILAFGLAACGGPEGYGNHNPRSGWVDIGDSDEMKCVGTTMLFKDTDRSSISTVANDPRCGGTPSSTPSPSPSF